MYPVSIRQNLESLGIQMLPSINSIKTQRRQLIKLGHDLPTLPKVKPGAHVKLNSPGVHVKLNTSIARAMRAAFENPNATGPEIARIVKARHGQNISASTANDARNMLVEANAVPSARRGGRIKPITAEASKWVDENRGEVRAMALDVAKKFGLKSNLYEDWIQEASMQAAKSYATFSPERGTTPKKYSKLGKHIYIALKFKIKSFLSKNTATQIGLPRHVVDTYYSVLKYAGRHNLTLGEAALQVLPKLKKSSGLGPEDIIEIGMAIESARASELHERSYRRKYGT